MYNISRYFLFLCKDCEEKLCHYMENRQKIYSAVKAFLVAAKKIGSIHGNYMTDRIKTGHIIFLAIMTLWLSLPVQGQNNPFKINDELYAYYQKCFRSVKDKKVLAMADTMFVMAKRKGDVKAECLAKNLKGEHYYYIGDLAGLKNEKKRIADFARNTPYKQYVFSPWNRLISLYLVRGYTNEALAEVRDYQREALVLNNAYGIGNAYRKMADVYIVTRSFDLALKELQKAESYYKENGETKELYNIYAAMANVYQGLNNTELEIKYYKLALETAALEESKGTYYLSLARAYLQKKQVPEVESYITMLNNWKKNYHLSPLSRDAEVKLYFEYSLLKKDNEAALKYANSMSDKNKDLFRAIAYEALGDFKSAYKAMALFYKITVASVNDEQKKLLADYASRYDNERVENEKNLLLLKNTQLQLSQLRTNDQLLAADKARNSLELSNTRLELNNKNLALERQRAEISRQRAEASRQAALASASASAELQKERTTRIFTVSVCIFLLLLSAGMLAYAVERRRATHRLQREIMEVSKARADAEKANRLKSLFLQNMSHEIRTPLNAIVGFSDVLNDADNQLEEGERNDFVNLIHENSDLLTTLINDILDISKLESGNYEISLRDVEVMEICRQALASVHDRVAKGVSLKFEKPEHSVVILTDPLRLKQVLINFLTNACKYTEKGSVTLGVIDEPEKVMFTVTDTGCGIAEENADRIFNRFEKLDEFKQGTGLGLNICRAIATLLGGRVWLDTSYHEGARFVFEHPKK